MFMRKTSKLLILSLGVFLLSPGITSCSKKYSVSPTKEEIQNECNRRTYHPEIPLKVEGNILTYEF